MRFKPALDRYFKLQQQIFDYFGYREDWTIIPIDDSTNYYWLLSDDIDSGGTVYFREEPLTKEIAVSGDGLYSNEIYTNRFLPKWVYRGPEYTMIVVDTHTDGNKFLQIFDNKKEQVDKELQKLLEMHW